MSMSILDKVVAAVAPPESAEAGLKARAKARTSAGKGDWLAMVLDHHEHIESAPHRYQTFFPLHGR